MYYPSLEQAQRLTAGGGFRRVPVSREILSDFTSPVQTLRVLQNAGHHCFLLESAEDNQRWGRFTFLGFHPSLEVTCANGLLRVRDVRSTDTRTEPTAHPGAALREILSRYKSPSVPGLPPFTGGLVGYFSYDYVKYSEPSLSLDADDCEGFQDMDLMLFDKVIAFDNYRQRLILIANADTENLAESYAAACRELDGIAELIRHGAPKEYAPGKLRSPLRPLFDEAQYCRMVERGKAYIREGDIFQVVLSNRLEADFDGSLLDAYRVLRASNPSPYMFYFSSDDIEIAGASPETLVKLQDGVLRTFPLAGTRPRGATLKEDIRLERDLLSDEKELAEHNMLVDLGRNDLGKISDFGTVEVENYLSVERFSHVMHIASTVRGRLRADRDAVDAVDAILPAGTLSGAPKFRAMEIINELENNKRGLYGGAVGYLDFAGNLDVCIAIRLAFKKNGKVFVRSGAGIVADSVPEREYRECTQKARAVVRALETAQGGELL
ncbi:MAG: anthranilate synthase component I family protein [Oscillibacter sp.]|nr:anthranilate synthase component I family protein [Oscillibacter sp.]